MLERRTKISSHFEFPIEYKRLTKSKKDIKDRILKSMSAAVFFAKITEWADSSHPTDYLKIIDFKTRITSLKYFRYIKKFNERNDVRLMLEADHQAFLRDVYNKEIISKIFSSIFYGNYQNKLDEKHIEYRKEIARILITRGSSELKSHMNSQYIADFEGEMDKGLRLLKSYAVPSNNS